MKQILLLGAALCVLPFCAGADTVRAAVGKPLLQAEALMRQGDYHAALLKVNQASATSHLTPYETLVIAQLRGAAAAGAGEYGVAAASYQTVLAAGATPPAERLQLTQAIAGFYYQAGDYPDTVTWVGRYIAAGGEDPRTRALRAQAYYVQGDFPHAAQAAAAEIAAEQAAGQTPSQPELQLLASSAQKSGDQAGYQAALDSLLVAYPSPAYWQEAISLLAASPNFPDALTLDLYRLRFATNTLTVPGDYEDYAERAILAGQPAEAKRVIDAGFAAGVLTDQTDAGHAARLRTLADTDSAQPKATPTDAPAATDPLDQGYAAFAAADSQAAIADFKTAAASPDHFAAALARLWEIRANN